MMFYVFAALGVAALAGVALWIYVMSNVEQQRYRVVIADGPIELRDYPASIVAEVTRQGSRQAAVNAGFGPLASYIFAKERAGDKIAMTAPVTQQRETIAMTAPVTQSAGANGDWTVRFIMPAKYTLETLPKPANADVRIATAPATRRAAIRFSGYATDAAIAEQEAALMAWMRSRKLTATGAATYAYYNDPFTPGPLRRNEVMFDVVEDEPRPASVTQPIAG
ncbi:MAG: heme-binding protein [Hyphomicrobiales bacterium]|nr:heme-binding protein [Hyphomicrobiales bacterium]